MSTNRVSKRLNWLLVAIYLAICGFFYEIWLGKEFFPYIYDYVRENNEVYVENGVREIVWGPYETLKNKSAHENELRVLMLVSTIKRSLINVMTFILPLPLTIKDFIIKPTLMKKFSIGFLVLVIVFFLYQYIDHLIQLQSYLEH